MYRAHRASTEGRMVGGGVGVWGDAEIGWRPTPEKNIETIPCWGKKIAQRIASWTWPSGANSLAHLQLKCILYVPL